MADTTCTIPLAGGEIEIVMYGLEGSVGIDHAKLAAGEATRLQDIFNLYDPKSELSMLNTKRGKTVSDELRYVLAKALQYSRETGGAYDITLGRQYLARKQGRPLPNVSCTYEDITMDENNVSLNHPDILIDLGSIAKGYIGDRIAEYMQECGIESGFIDARGDMRAFGSRTETVAIQHPRKNGRIYDPILLQNNSVATSGDYVQYTGSYDNCHIVGESDLASVTTVAERLADADAIATCVFVLGSREAGKFLSKHPEIKALTVDKKMGISAYNGFQSLIKGEAASEH
ncbi:MAG: FAD:protein FMN transferase [Candidatus Altiarchaeota archaeon]|nr:FAD:protein FMN transferase [Candidatus Altiarchaeota archaeon]